MLFQLVEGFVHLERGREGLDQDGRLDRAGLEAERRLGEEKDLVPDPRLAVALKLREIEVGAGAAREQLVRVVEEVEAEVEERPWNGFPVERDVALRKVEPPRANHEHGGPLVQAVLLSRRGIVEGGPAPHG